MAANEKQCPLFSVYSHIDENCSVLSRPIVVLYCEYAHLLLDLRAAGETISNTKKIVIAKFDTRTSKILKREKG